MNEGTILASMVWGSVAVGCIIYGKKQGATVPMVGGFALLAVSYLIPNSVYMSLVSVALLCGMGWFSKQGY
jgi:hypothetical protein